MMWATGPFLVVLFVCLFLTPTHIFYYLTSGWWRLNWVKMLKKTKKQLQQQIKYPTDITYSPTERSLTEIWRFATSAYTHLGHINYPAFQHIFIAPGVALAAAEECGPGQRARIVFPYETEATRVFIFFFLPSSAPLCSSGVILAISCDKVKSRAGGAPVMYSWHVAADLQPHPPLHFRERRAGRRRWRSGPRWRRRKCLRQDHSLRGGLCGSGV